MAEHCWHSSLVVPHAEEGNPLAPLPMNMRKLRFHAVEICCWCGGYRNKTSAVPPGHGVFLVAETIGDHSPVELLRGISEECPKAPKK